ncbi:MAG: prolipoprotein diacylglyceryl transferase [Pirellulales bacterium]|nr:prolipoprotein diacylglyceryl transferase [Pirellulales bacterium]
MHQTLFHIPAEVAGLQVFGFGLLLAAWAVLSVGLIIWLAWRQGFNADTWGYVPILLLIGAIIAWVLPALGKGQGLPIRGYGTMMLLAVVTATALAVWRGKRAGVEPEAIYSIVFWMLVPGIIGARVFYIVEYWPRYAAAFSAPNGGIGPFLGNLINLTEGGLVVYGSLLGGMIGLLAIVRLRRLPLLAVCDLMAPSMALGLAIGRIGCLLNGCCFGGECDLPWAVAFPPETPAYFAQVERGRMFGITLDDEKNSPPRVFGVDAGSPAADAGLKSGDLIRRINESEIAATADAHAALAGAFYDQRPLKIDVEGRPRMEVPAVEPPPRSLPVHPTQIYSSINAFLICLLLLIWSPRRRRDGELLALLLTIYPIARFIMEIIRTDESSVFGTGMSISQNVSVLVLFFAAGLWFHILRRPPGLAFSPAKEENTRREKHPRNR